MSALPLAVIGSLALAYLPLAGALSVVDIREHRLPNPLVLGLSAAVAGVVAISALLVPSARGTCLLALVLGLAAGLLAVTVALLAADLLGMGDAKILPSVIATSAMLGWDVLIGGLLGAAVLGGVLGVVALLVTRDARVRIAYGPVLLAVPVIGVPMAGPVRAALGV